jgi:hypothetical protein
MECFLKNFVDGCLLRGLFFGVGDLESCKNSNHEISDHFADVSKMVAIGLGTERGVEEIKLTRYACYLIAQNGDPRKEEIAFAQSYFAVQTRKQEIIEDHIRLAERLKDLKKNPIDHLFWSVQSQSLS